MLRDEATSSSNGTVSSLKLPMVVLVIIDLNTRENWWYKLESAPIHQTVAVK